ncbi:metallophosphoesterase [soil metagenome]
MRLGILSDTHDWVQLTAGAVALLQAEGAEALIHCGDLTGPEIVQTCASIPSYFVFGNCDHDHQTLRRVIEKTGGNCLGRAGSVSLGGRRIAVTHGHLTDEVERLARAEPDYLLFGHTHRASDLRDGPTRFINPGALDRVRQCTVALLDLEDDSLRFLEVR